MRILDLILQRYTITFNFIQVLLIMSYNKPKFKEFKDKPRSKGIKNARSMGICTKSY